MCALPMCPAIAGPLLMGDAEAVRAVAFDRLPDFGLGRHTNEP
jgi:hypothetical protein